MQQFIQKHDAANLFKLDIPIYVYKVNRDRHIGYTKIARWYYQFLFFCFYVFCHAVLIMNSNFISFEFIFRFMLICITFFSVTQFFFTCFFFRLPKIFSDHRGRYFDPWISSSSNSLNAKSLCWQTSPNYAFNWLDYLVPY